MSVFHDEIEIEDFEFDEDTETYYYPCPCGDKFAISRAEAHFMTQLKRKRGHGFLAKQEDLESGEEVATCPSCSLIVRVIYDKELFMSGEIIAATAEPKRELVQSS